MSSLFISDGNLCDCVSHRWSVAAVIISLLVTVQIYGLTINVYLMHVCHLSDVEALVHWR